MMDTQGEQARVDALYRLYVSNGAHLKWATHFGSHCPEPDFVGAVARERTEQWRAARHFVSHYRWWFIALVLLVVSLMAFLLARRFRVFG
jgi:hypothetical protein